MSSPAEKNGIAGVPSSKWTFSGDGQQPLFIQSFQGFKEPTSGPNYAHAKGGISFPRKRC